MHQSLPLLVLSSLHVGILLIGALTPSFARAEVRIIRATGEYRMGDNDTRADAKRIALLDAKRLALEQAGTYVESITQVKNMDLTREEILAYAAGIVEVVEQATRTVHEGDTTVLRVDVEVKIDTDVVARQISVLRKNAEMKAELKKLREDAESLRQQLLAKTSELRTQRTKEAVGVVTAQRRQIIDRALANDLAERATTLWIEFTLTDLTAETEGRKRCSTTSKQTLARARDMAEKALATDSANARARRVMATILIDEGDCHFRLGDNEAGLVRLREAVRVDPGSAFAHSRLAEALSKMGDHSDAITEQDIAIALKPDAALGYVGLGDLLLTKGDVDAAITEYRRAIELDANQPHGHLSLSRALKKKGQEEDSQRELCQGVRLSSNVLPGGEADPGLPAFRKAQEKLLEHLHCAQDH